MNSLNFESRSMEKLILRMIYIVINILINFLNMRRKKEEEKIASLYTILTKSIFKNDTSE